MDRIEIAADDALTRTLARRVHVLWDAYRSVNAERLNAVLADDYISVHPDGTVHPHKATLQEIAAAAIDDYRITRLKAFPIGERAALVTYTAEIGVGSHISPTKIRFAVGEVWMKYVEDWKCRYYQATMLR